jgi:hypothetical protein
MEEYENKLKAYMQSIVNNQFIFELTKCCGYSEFLPIFSSCKLSDLYNNVYHKLEIKSDNNIKLFVVNSSTNEKIEIPNDSNVFIKDFIKLFKHYFTPIYPVPAKVVHKIYYDSGCCHNTLHMDTDINKDCIIHK